MGVGGRRGAGTYFLCFVSVGALIRWGGGGGGGEGGGIIRRCAVIPGNRVGLHKTASNNLLLI